MAVPKDPRDLETTEPFVSLFPIDPDTRGVVARSMSERGYIADKPILAWRDAFGEHGRTVVVDGHTRLAVAHDLGLDSVHVTLRRFDSVEDALITAIDEQSWRRSLSRSQLVVYVLAALDTLDNGYRGQGARNDLYGRRTAVELAALLGITTRTIERARQLISFGDDELLAQVKAGELSLKAAIERAKRDDAAPEPAPAVEPEPEPEEEAEPGPAPTPQPELERTAARLKTIGDNVLTPKMNAEFRAEEERQQAKRDEPEPEEDDEELEPQTGGLSDWAYVFWNAVQEVRAFDRLTAKPAHSAALVSLLVDFLDYFGIHPTDDDDTVQDMIVGHTWDPGEEPGPAPWESDS